MSRPDVTKAQIIASVAAGVPIVVSLLAAFGFWHPTHAESEALKSATAWAAGFAGLLVLGDSHLRASRNAADAVKATAAAATPGRVVPLRAGEAIPSGSPVALGPPVVTGSSPTTSIEPDRVADADEIDLADPALDDPGPQSGLDHEALEAHAATAATSTDLAERDSMKGAQA